MTEEQENCEYCHFDTLGTDFSDTDRVKFQLANFKSGRYYINVWRWTDDNDFDVDSEAINFCPMCGRKLGKDGQA